MRIILPIEEFYKRATKIKIPGSEPNTERVTYLFPKDLIKFDSEDFPKEMLEYARVLGTELREINARLAHFDLEYAGLIQGKTYYYINAVVEYGNPKSGYYPFPPDGTTWTVCCSGV